MVEARDAGPDEIRFDERPFQILARGGDRGETVSLSSGSLLSRTAVRGTSMHRR